MTINKDIAGHLDDRIYTQGYEPEKRRLDFAVKRVLADTEIIYINSNMAKIHTLAGADTGKRYIVWDETFWHIYYQFLALVSAPSDQVDLNAEWGYPLNFARFHELGSWVIGVFSDYLSRKYDRKYSLSSVIMTDLTTTNFPMFQKVFDYELRHEDRGKPLAIPLVYSKFYILYHEIAHLHFQRDAAVKQSCRDFVIQFYAAEEPFLDELAADAYATQALSKMWVTEHKGSTRLLFETVKAVNIFLFYFNLINVHWDLYYSKYVIDKKDAVDEPGAALKEGIVNADYKETLSFPFILRKELVLTETEEARLSQAVHDNETRHIEYCTYLLSYLAHTIGYNENEPTDFEINKDFYQDLNLKIFNTLLDKRYISSRILSAMEKKYEIDRAAHQRNKMLQDEISKGIKIMGDEIKYEEYDKHFVCYLKILGLKDCINNNNVHALEKVLNALQGLEEVRQNLRREQEARFSIAGKNETSFHLPANMSFCFDSAILSYRHVEPQNDMLDLYRIMFDINILLYQLLAIGIFVRGGFTYGEVYHQGDVCFGPALIEAMELARGTVFPRVAIASYIFDRDSDRFPYKKMEINEKIYRTTFKKLRDEKAGYALYEEKPTYFFDFLYQFLNRETKAGLVIRENIINELKKPYNDSIKKKYLWMKDYFNGTLSALDFDGISKIGDDSAHDNPAPS